MVAEPHVLWLAAGLFLKGHSDFCSCLRRRCDFSVWFEYGEAAEDPKFFTKDEGTVVVARIQRHVSSPWSPEQIAAHAELFLAFVCVVKPIELVMICDPDLESPSPALGW